MLNYTCVSLTSLNRRTRHGMQVFQGKTVEIDGVNLSEIDKVPYCITVQEINHLKDSLSTGVSIISMRACRVVDVDSTVKTAYGKQQGVKKGQAKFFLLKLIVIGDVRSRFIGTEESSRIIKQFSEKHNGIRENA